MGDFNIHIDDLHCSQANTFMEMIDAFGLIQHVQQPIHKHGHILDLIVTRQDKPVGDVKIAKIIRSYLDELQRKFELDQGPEILLVLNNSHLKSFYPTTEEEVKKL